MNTLQALQALRDVLNAPGIPTQTDMAIITEAIRVVEETGDKSALDYATAHLKGRIAKAWAFVVDMYINGTFDHDGTLEMIRRAHERVELTPEEWQMLMKFGGYDTTMTAKKTDLEAGTQTATLQMQRRVPKRITRDFEARRAAGARVREAFAWTVEDNMTRPLSEIGIGLQQALIDPEDLQPGMMIGREIVPPLQLSDEDQPLNHDVLTTLGFAPMEFPRPDDEPVSSASPSTEDEP